MAFENLSSREKEILANLINYYISSADPVGSRIIANKYEMGISSATIRNTLQDLEDLGLVQQPHTSAGRIPTDLGYRVYVDYLLKPEELSDVEKNYIKSSILKHGRGINEILGQTCHILSEITQQLGITISPRFESGILKSLNLIQVSSERIMVIVIVQSGLARSMILEVEANIDERELRDVELALNERLTGLSLGEIKRNISIRLKDLTGSGRLIKLIIDSKDKILTESNTSDVHISGTDNLVTKPEFSDINKVVDLVKLLEDGVVLKQFLNDAIDEGIIITIGGENKFKEIMNCSLVTSQYRVGKIRGRIAVVGPTRMAYNKLVSVVDYTARTITDLLSGLNN
jgi:heat-inducible transcriptional repressor